MKKLLIKNADWIITMDAKKNRLKNSDMCCLSVNDSILNTNCRSKKVVPLALLYFNEHRLFCICQDSFNNAVKLYCHFAP